MGSDAEPGRVLVAEDDACMRALVARRLRRDGFLVEEAANGDDALERLAETLTADRRYAAIVADVRMPGFTGLELLATARNLPAPVPFFLVTAFGDADLHAEARDLGAHAVLDKPFDIDLLGQAVRDAVPGARKERP